MRDEMVLNNSPLFIEHSIKEELIKYSVDDIKVKMQLLKQNWIENIEVLKEKTESELKSHFFEDIFVKVLSYKPVTTGGGGSWNLSIESSTEVDSQRPDAILGRYTKDKFNNKTYAVVELKGPKIELDLPQNRYNKNYGTPVEQGFKYTPKYDGCKWVIVSNIYELRLYQVGRSTVYYETFFLEDLAKNEEIFKKFHFILNKYNLLGEKTNELSENAYKKLEHITNKFYNLYSDTRVELWDSLKKENSSFEELELLSKAQKILDRIIFICFAQGKGLLPNNILLDYIYAAENTHKMNTWNFLKELFRSIDIGNKEEKINQFNGELFKHDSILDYELNVPNHVFESIKLIANHDFTEDININILGHIFEQSISDIEELKNGGNSYRRKKEGIFYTPEYLTKYIVENTLLHWIKDKKNELGYNNLRNWKEADSLTGRTRRVNEAYKFWNLYSKTLDTVRILDPACGSGAFLNQAFDQLMNEKKNALVQLRNLEILINTDPDVYESINMTFQQPNLFNNDLDKSILSENLFGVDLNRESVEISKLSLWLNTANPNKKLTNLEGNLKSGNSIIDDPEISNEFSFKWSDEFSSVMDNGGFDIIIGNPPYVLSRDGAFNKKEKLYFSKKYSLQQDKPNTYLLFIEKAIGLLKHDGYLGFIVPNSWLGIDSATKLRKYLLENTEIKSITNLYGISFPDANVETVVIILKKINPKSNEIMISNIKSKKLKITYSDSKKIPQKTWLQNRNYIFDLISDEEDNLIIDKIYRKSVLLKKIAKPQTGLQAYEKDKGTPKQTKSDVEKRTYDYNYKYDDETYKYLVGNNVKRYHLSWGNEWLRYGKWLAQPRKLSTFSGERILIREVVGKYPHSLLATYETDLYLNNKSILNILPLQKGYCLKYILAILNSEMISFYFKRKAVKSNRTLFPKITKGDLDTLPIPMVDAKTQRELGNLATELILLNSELFNKIEKAQKILMAEYQLKISRNLTEFYNLNWIEFTTEIKKQDKSFSILKQGDDLLEWFQNTKEPIMLLQTKIDKIERQINEKIYSILKLTEKEINIIRSFNLG